MNRPHPLQRKRRALGLEIRSPPVEQGMGSVEPFYQEILSLMSCPVCLGLMTEGYIFSCVNDHLTCECCWKYLSDCRSTCPTCRSTWRGRSRFAENIRNALIENAEIPCPNQIFGCQGRFMKSLMNPHLAWCCFQQVFCPATHEGACRWRGSLRRLDSHVRAESCALVLPGSILKRVFTLTVNLLTGRPKVRYVLFTKIAPAESPVCLVMLRENEGVYIYLRMVGAPSVEKGPLVTVSVLRMPDESTAFSMLGEIHPPTSNFAMVKQSGTFLFLDEAQLILLHDENRLLVLKVAFPLEIPGPSPSHSPVRVEGEETPGQEAPPVPSQ